MLQAEQVLALRAGLTPQVPRTPWMCPQSGLRRTPRRHRLREGAEGSLLFSAGKGQPYLSPPKKVSQLLFQIAAVISPWHLPRVPTKCQLGDRRSGGEQNAAQNWGAGTVRPASQTHTQTLRHPRRVRAGQRGRFLARAETLAAPNTAAAPTAAGPGAIRANPEACSLGRAPGSRDRAP